MVADRVGGLLRVEAHVKDWFKLHPFNDYASAMAHLDKRAARVRRDAPLGNAVRLVADLVAAPSVSVVYHQTPIVTFWPNGTQMLHWGGWFTKTTFAHIERYADLGDLRLAVRNPDKHRHGDGAVYWMTTFNWNRTPSRITRCRACKGTGQAESKWHTGRCYRCNGRREIERGNQPVRLEIEHDEILNIGPGGMLTLDHATADIPTYECKCEVCRCGCDSWQTHHWCKQAGKKTKAAMATAWDDEEGFAGLPGDIAPPFAAPVGPEMGSAVADALTHLIPAIRSTVVCPVTGTRKSLRDTIVTLNDQHRWTRERVADWLDTLDLDLRFPVPA